MGSYSVRVKKRLKNGKIIKIKKYRWEFQYKKKRYQASRLFNTKTESDEDELRVKNLIRNPPTSTTQKTSLTFGEMVNRRLMEYKAYSVKKHFEDIKYLAKGWGKQWREYPVDEITSQMIKNYIFLRGGFYKTGDKEGLERPHTANKEIKFLRALFTWGKKQNPPLCMNNPAINIPYFPTEKFVKYVPPIEEVTKVLWAADQDERDYLYTIWDTKGRMGEINNILWNDIYLELSGELPWKKSFVVLYTRKSKDGSKVGRKISLTKRLYNIFVRRFRERDKTKPWIFWHRYYSRKINDFMEGPYAERSKLMKTLCAKAGVKYFRFHALRHSGASIMAENPNIKTRTIMKILGHQRESTTEKYIHSLGDAEILAQEEFEKDSEGVMREKRENGPEN